MINRICISINNRCNLRCEYCHFHEKEADITEKTMDVFKILDNVKEYIDSYDIKLFKIGFVGNGEPLLNFDELKKYVLYINEYLRTGKIAAYTITNGTIADNDKMIFLKEHNVDIGFSIDGISTIHNKLRCNSYSKVMDAIERYKYLFGRYPSMNCTVGSDVLNNSDETISFFKKFNTRITFSRMIGQYGISRLDFKKFMEKASEQLNVRTGGFDCTMYGGMCGAGINNYFYANGYVYLCGNCNDMPSLFTSDTPIDKINFNISQFDRENCYKEVKEN